jgi:radical SAM superfamily enzyme YgiQ (UPF0313 family)
MRVLLLSPPYLPEYMRNARCDYVSLSHTQWYPIWLSYCGALLEEKNHEIKIIDAPAYGLNHTKTKKAIISFRPELLVVYSSTKSEDNDIKFSEQIKEILDCKVVFVGPFVSIDPVNLLQKSSTIDCAVKGEFEYPVLELAENYEYKDIKNLAFRDGNIVRINKLRPLLDTFKLDNLPFVTKFYKRHLNLRKYKVPQELYPFVDLFTGRGCKWGICSFCLWVHSFIPGATYNKRSIENVMEEIKFVKKEIPEAKEIFIQDDTLPEDRARELSEAILGAGLKVVWSCYLRANVSFNTLKLMKRAGCRNVHVGYENASLHVLKRAKKGLTPQTMTKFTQEAKMAGLAVHGDFLIGLNGETVTSIKKTIEWAKTLELDTAQFSIINIYPKTPFYEYLSKHGYIEGGEPSYPYLPREEIRKWAKRAYREFYFRNSYLKSVFKNPKEKFFLQFHSIYDMIKSIFWKEW